MISYIGIIGSYVIVCSAIDVGLLVMRNNGNCLVMMMSDISMCISWALLMSDNPVSVASVGWRKLAHHEPLSYIGRRLWLLL